MVTIMNSIGLARCEADLTDGWVALVHHSYNESREHYEIGYAPYGMNGIQDMATGASVTNADRGAATVARCIREYDNVATANE